MVLIFISLMITDTEYLFRHLLAIYVSSLYVLFLKLGGGDMGVCSVIIL